MITFLYVIKMVCFQNNIRATNMISLEINGDCLNIAKKFVTDNSLKMPPYTKHDLCLIKPTSRLLNESFSSTDLLMTAFNVMDFLSVTNLIKTVPDGIV